jgi:peroxiredoxin
MPEVTETTAMPAPSGDTNNDETHEERVVGWGVLHLFFRVGQLRSETGAEAWVRRGRQAVLDALSACEKDGYQVICSTILGHKADLCVMALGPDLARLRGLQTELTATGLDLVDSYVSLTELSEYAPGLPQAMRQERLRPVLPPAEMPAFCFYPMSKRRAPGAENWYALAYEERRALMSGHGRVGRTFRGRVLQLVTGSAGLDDYEWGVTLFATHPEELKTCVYQMRYDLASAKYAEFGPFVMGFVDSPEAVLDAVGLGPSA